MRKVSNIIDRNMYWVCTADAHILMAPTTNRKSKTRLFGQNFIYWKNSHASYSFLISIIFLLFVRKTKTSYRARCTLIFDYFDKTGKKVFFVNSWTFFIYKGFQSIILRIRVLYALHNAVFLFPIKKKFCIEIGSLYVKGSLWSLHVYVLKKKKKSCAAH